jgi:hypothetical protein
VNTPSPDDGPSEGSRSATPTEPPSLRRRAPARVSLTLKSGQSPDVIRGRIHIRAGRTLIVQVIPPSALAKVEVVPEHPLAEVMPVTRIEGGPVPNYYVEYTGSSPLRVIPLPVTGKLHVSVSDGQPNPFRMTIPVTVWPSGWTLAMWWLVAVASVVGLRWQSALARSDSALEIIPKIRSDSRFLGELLLLGVATLLFIRLLGWLVVLAEPRESGR